MKHLDDKLKWKLKELFTEKCNNNWGWNNQTQYEWKPKYEWKPFNNTIEKIKEHEAAHALARIIEIIKNHKPIPKDVLTEVAKDESIKCVFMSLIKQHYSTEEMENFLKTHKGFLDNI